ncbi:maleylpyruvate isomerase N-terminal domain-containing protein [Crossiella sp. SN42]|uniref:maleylpyruvate isomerase N-terminal domain-containing protein n=1 Tax=Crossiella sp. SN42 TaxID=2944808 RepID=UPI00207CCB77|nr:maleylpyruvate isomerase N-terminal domain-containing protein [Crossiella sp. SN42]MCO1581734.1 maleylpyruvate isomerase N-terminal domain-containing protein [Crossiella sp. SN42]
MSGQALIDPARLLDTLRAEGELLAVCAAGADLGSAVPAWPRRTLGEAVRAAAHGYRLALSWLRTGAPPLVTPAEQEPAEPLPDQLRSGLRELAEELAAHDPYAPCPTWWPADSSYGFWRRRIAHESTLHRVDAQSAAGEQLLEIAPEFAVDGVDEALLLWLGYRLGRLGITGPQRGTVGLRTGGHAWLVHTGPEGTVAERVSATEAAGADGLVTGEPMSVYLWLWGRVPDRTVTLAGSRDATAQLWALLRLATTAG